MTSSSNFTERMKRQRDARPAHAPVNAASTFSQTRPVKEAAHRTTINIPMSIYEAMRVEAFETGVSMGEQLIKAWARERHFGQQSEG
jgi:hypothetical protein